MSFSLHYLEKPITEDERQVAALLEKIIQAFRTKNLDLLASVHSADATITTFAAPGTLLRKNEYIEYMSKIIETVRYVSFQDILIRIKDQEAIISCWVGVVLRNAALPKIARRFYRCVKRGTFWYIAESSFIE